MLLYGLFLLFCGSTVALAQSTSQVTISSVGSPTAGLAAESLAMAIGTDLTTQTGTGTPPWPTQLSGVQLQVTDSANVPRPAGLLYVSPTQINFEVPAGTATGAATVMIVTSGGPPFVVPVQIQAVAPALLRMNSLGVAAATAIRVVIPSTIQSPVPVMQCVDTPGSCRLVPIALGVDTPIYLSFYGTGIRGRSSLSNVKITIGTVDVTPLFAGPQPQFPGLDQVNVPLPLSLRGAGEVNVTITVDGITSDPVKINVM